jgi:hypothetical protein
VRTLKSLLVVLQNEPVLTRAVVGALLILGVEAGLPIDDGLAKALDGLVVAVLALGARGRVTPVDPAPRPTSVPDALKRILGKA